MPKSTPATVARPRTGDRLPDGRAITATKDATKYRHLTLDDGTTIKQTIGEDIKVLRDYPTPQEYREQAIDAARRAATSLVERGERFTAEVISKISERDLLDALSGIDVREMSIIAQARYSQHLLDLLDGLHTVQAEEVLREYAERLHGIAMEAVRYPGMSTSPSRDMAELAQGSAAASLISPGFGEFGSVLHNLDVAADAESNGEEVIRIG